MKLVSGIIPYYNQAQFLGEAIKSALSQTCPHFEIIVVDDGLTDNTSMVASYYPEICLIQQANQCPSAARNRSLKGCKGSCGVFLDADDRFLPNVFEIGLKSLTGCFKSGRA